MKTLEKVEKTIKEHNLLEYGQTVLVGLSGGPDSVCLLHLMCQLRVSLGVQVYAVHVNHNLRGEFADRDQQYAQELCAKLQVPIRVYSYDILSIAKERCISTEDAGRQMRYQAFFEERETMQATDQVRIAVAHNQNDQAETVFMRIMRGTGIQGLGGMEYKREDGVIRPILDLSRSEIEQYCEAHQLHPCIDATNLEPVYTRNRIRLELIPYMQQHFNENIIETINRLATIAREETSFIDDVVSDYVGKEIDSMAEGIISISVEKMRSMPATVQKRAILQILSNLGLKQNLSAVHLDQASTVIRGNAWKRNESKIVEFPLGFRMEKQQEQVHFFKTKQMHGRLTEDREKERNESGAEYGQDHKKCESKGCIKEKLLKNDGNIELKKLPDHIRCFDYDKIRNTGFQWCLRTRKPGDFIQPLGMDGTKKLQDYFVDKKIPKEKRDAIPLVCLGQEILWIVGGQISEKFKVTDGSENILLLEFNKSM